LKTEEEREKKVREAGVATDNIFNGRGDIKFKFTTTKVPKHSQLVFW
jgi:hypothetical protein